MREGVAQLDAVVRLASVGVPLPLGEVYREVFGEGMGIVSRRFAGAERRTVVRRGTCAWRRECFRRAPTDSVNRVPRKDAPSAAMRFVNPGPWVAAASQDAPVVCRWSSRALPPPGVSAL